jgi:cytochrome d ubiquinol oxidase subunit I
MDAALLARIQFAGTIGFHFIFAPMGIGLSWLVFALLTKYRRTGDERYRQLARLWSRVLALSFGIGVATGITMEFQFGTNWAAYSRFVGDIFGAPLAAEVIFTFFLESTFLYVLVFGWDRVSPRVHYISSFLVALGSTMSAFFILVANSWMQTPTGYVLRNGRAELVSFWGAVFSPSMPARFSHTVDGALMTGVFFLAGVHLLGAAARDGALQRRHGRPPAAGKAGVGRRAFPDAEACAAAHFWPARPRHADGEVCRDGAQRAEHPRLPQPQRRGDWTRQVPAR